MWAAPLALVAAALAGASLPPLALALVAWALASLLPSLRLVLLLAAPLALALGMDLPREALDALATLAAVLLSLAPLVLYLGGPPTLRQVSVAASIAGGVTLLALTPWARTLARSDLAPGALTLAIAGVSLVALAAFTTPEPRAVGPP